MNFSEEQLNELEEMAGLFFSPEDIAINLQLKEEETDYFVTCIESRSQDPGSVAYYRGRLSAEIILRRAVKQSALNGSSPSQLAMLNFHRESRK